MGTVRHVLVLKVHRSGALGRSSLPTPEQKSRCPAHLPVWRNQRLCCRCPALDRMGRRQRRSIRSSTIQELYRGMRAPILFMFSSRPPLCADVFCLHDMQEVCCIALELCCLSQPIRAPIDHAARWPGTSVESKAGPANAPIPSSTAGGAVMERRAASKRSGRKTLVTTAVSAGS